jgi:hypothetical protein
MGNYFSSSKGESIQIINETDHVHVIVTNSGEPMEKKDEHVTKIEESMLKEVKENVSITSVNHNGVLNEDEGEVEHDDILTMDANVKIDSNCIHYVIQKRNLKKKNKKKNKKKHHLQ